MADQLLDKGKKEGELRTTLAVRFWSTNSFLMIFRTAIQQLKPWRRKSKVEGTPLKRETSWKTKSTRFPLPYSSIMLVTDIIQLTTKINDIERGSQAQILQLKTQASQQDKAVESKLSKIMEIVGNEVTKDASSKPMVAIKKVSNRKRRNYYIDDL